MGAQLVPDEGVRAYARPSIQEASCDSSGCLELDLCELPKVLRRKEGQFITVICPKFLVWSALGQEDEVHEQRQQGEGQGGGQRERLPEPASLRAVPRPFVHPAFPSVSMQEPQAVADQGHENKITSFISKKNVGLGKRHNKN